MSNLENFLVFKAQRRDDPRVQSQNLVFNAGLETDHVISGPMRRLEKKHIWNGHQTNKQTGHQIDRHVDSVADLAQRAESVETMTKWSEFLNVMVAWIYNKNVQFFFGFTSAH